MITNAEHEAVDTFRIVDGECFFSITRAKRGTSTRLWGLVRTARAREVPAITGFPATNSIRANIKNRV